MVTQAMNWKEENGEFVSDDELVCVYQCRDGSWRVAYYPFADKDRNIKTREEAFRIAEKRHAEALELDKRLDLNAP